MIDALDQKRILTRYYSQIKKVHGSVAVPIVSQYCKQVLALFFAAVLAARQDWERFA